MLFLFTFWFDQLTELVYVCLGLNLGLKMVNMVNVVYTYCTYIYNIL